MNATPLPTMLNRDDFAAAARISRKTFGKLLKSGELPVGRRIGRRMLWPADVVEAFLRGQPIPTGEAVPAPSSN